MDNKTKICNRFQR